MSIKHPEVTFPYFFHRNNVNLGNVGNWIVFGDIAHGKMFVKADGDDVSLPERTEKIVNAWLLHGMTAMVIDHTADVIDVNGRLTGKKRWILGAAQAYSRECWDKFPVKGATPSRNWVGDDTIFSIRAHAIAGAAQYQLLMADSLVRYRCGSGATTTYRKFRDTLKSYTTECIMYALRDVELNKDSLISQNVAATRDWCLSRVRESELNKQLAFGSSFAERLTAAKSLRKEFRRVSFRDLTYQALLSLPPVFTDSILDFYLRHMR